MGIKDVILGYEYVNNGIWRIWESAWIEVDGEKHTKKWRELMCEMPPYNPNNVTAEFDKKRIGENGELIVCALNEKWQARRDDKS